MSHHLNSSIDIVSDFLSANATAHSSSFKFADCGSGVLVVGLFSEDFKKLSDGKEIDCKEVSSASSPEFIAAVSRGARFCAKFGDNFTLFPEKDRTKIEKIIFVCFGSKISNDLENQKRVAELSMKIIAATKKDSDVHFGISSLIDKPKQMNNVIYSLIYHSYEFTRYKKRDLVKSNYHFYDIDGDLKNEFQDMQFTLRGVFIARTLSNYAPNDLYPESYAAVVSKILSPLGVNVKILDERKLQELKMDGIYSVGKGSARKPCAVIMEWNAKENDLKAETIALVGKGVTFDTGGISIKPASKMEEMKFDMSGSATVVGTMMHVAMKKIPISVVGVIGLAENMPSSGAMRPGDVIGSMSGKTVEVLNTDAEGRLVLMDMLYYAQKIYHAKTVIDLATLTGAIVVSFGSEYAGIFSNSDDLAKSLTDSSTNSGEKIWRLPLDKEYDRTIDSKIADIKNISDDYKGAGSITAAQFLQRFINPSTEWAHIDIAGVANKGGFSTGFGVRLLSDWIKSRK